MGWLTNRNCTVFCFIHATSCASRLYGYVHFLYWHCVCMRTLSYECKYYHVCMRVCVHVVSLCFVSRRILIKKNLCHWFARKIYILHVFLLLSYKVLQVSESTLYLVETPHYSSVQFWRLPSVLAGRRRWRQMRAWPECPAPLPPPLVVAASPHLPLPSLHPQTGEVQNWNSNSKLMMHSQQLIL